MKRRHDGMDTDDADILHFELAEDVPLNENEVIVETTPSPDLVDFQDNISVVYQNLGEALEAQLQGMRPQSSESMRYGQETRHRLYQLKTELTAENVDIVEVGKILVFGTVDNSIETSKSVDRVIKSASVCSTEPGDIELTNLVTSLMHKSAIDVRFGMVGSSVMWNVLKTNIRSMNHNINSKVTAVSANDCYYQRNDLDIANLPEKSYKIEPNDPFVEADLRYIFSLLTFRDNAKLLNKTKQFIKAYLIVSCRPRCLIWGYTVRKSGSCHKKTITDLPPYIVETIIDFLLDATGIGRQDVSFEQLDKNTPFYAYLGYLCEEKKEEYDRSCRNRDGLIQFFRNAITDCLNEIREMPFNLETGALTGPLRGRVPTEECITWKQFESLLKEHNEPDLMMACRKILEKIKRQQQCADSDNNAE